MNRRPMLDWLAAVLGGGAPVARHPPDVPRQARAERGWRKGAHRPGEARSGDRAPAPALAVDPLRAVTVVS